MNETIFNESHKVVLTEKEIRESAEKLAKLIADISDKEAEKKEIASRFKADVERMQNDASGFAAMVRNKYEYRSVECREDRDHKEAEIFTIRLDTGEEIRRRKMTETEKQESLKLGKEKKAGRITPPPKGEKEE